MRSKRIKEKKYAESIFEKLIRRERIGLLAKFSGIALDNAELLVAANCGKSTLNQVTRDMLTQLRNDIKRDYCDDGPDAIVAFTVLVVQYLEKVMNNWKSSEINLPSCFYIEEAKTDSIEKYN